MLNLDNTIVPFLERSIKIILLLFLIVPTSLFSQEIKKESSNQQKVDAYSGETAKKNTPKFKGKISGKVKNSVDQKTLEFATVSLVDFETNVIVEGTITDAKGRFYFNDINVGKYNVTINFIGFEEKTIIVETSKKKPDTKVNNIVLNQSSELLSEVKIEEEKTIYESRIDKIVYNAEHDLNESENDATDVLRKAPLLSVDLDGNVSLRGSRNIKFLVNGKASSFFSSDVATALQMIPADQIKTIEVITSPGAKYDGEGDAGIVNIITKKAIIDGYNATINTMIGTKVTRSGFNLNLGKGRFGLSARANMHGSWPGRIGTDTYTRLDWDSVDIAGNPVNPNILTQDGESENHYQGYRGSVNAFYDVNAYNSFNSSLKFGGRTMPTENNNSIVYAHGTNPDSLSYSSEYISIKTNRTLNMEWTTDYTRKFADNEDRELTLALQLGGDINDGNTDIDEDGRNLFNQNDEKVIEETFQIDYTHPFGSPPPKGNKISSNRRSRSGGEQGHGRGGKKGGSRGASNSNKIEIGGKIINRDREMVYSNQGVYQNAEEFNYNQLVTSSYLSTEFSLPHGLGFKTGLRYENTQTSGNWLTKPDDPFEKSYEDLLPNFVFSKSFSPMRSIKVSYNQRIRRPSVKHINTNEDKLDNRNITIGNPHLEPTITEQYELGINSFGKILQGSTQLYYKHSFNVIESFLDEIDGEASISTYKNIGESKQIGGSFFGSINLKKLNFRGSFDIYNYSGRDKSLGYEDWTTPVILYSYFIGGSYNLGKNWKAETFGYFRSPTQTIQGSTTSWSMRSFGVKKTFKNKRGSIGLRIIEPFQEDKEFISDLEGDFFSQSSLRTISYRSFAISFKYTIGKLNFKDANNKTNIKNDDIQQEEGGEF
ncbi:TonB-dependent receptor [Flavobacteriales bacterium]|nr:TonB-dependent receptor [Flavobacteriales bacterium]